MYCEFICPTWPRFTCKAKENQRVKFNIAGDLPAINQRTGNIELSAMRSLVKGYLERVSEATKQHRGWGLGGSKSLYKELASEPGEGENHWRGTRPLLVMDEPTESMALNASPSPWS